MEQLESAKWSQTSWIILGSYSLGCLTAGYYVVRRRAGLDLRELGSGSVGAKNAGRVLGWTGFVMTLLWDSAKGALAVWMVQHSTGDARLVAFAMLAVVVGHLWPAQLHFRGGKGVATSLGALLIYDFHLAVAFALCFAGGLAVLRKTILPALFAFTCLPLVSAYLDHDAGRTAEPTKVVCLSILAGLILFAHRKNLFEEFSHLIERRDLPAEHHPPEI